MRYTVRFRLPGRRPVQVHATDDLYDAQARARGIGGSVVDKEACRVLSAPGSGLAGLTAVVLGGSQ